MGETRILAFGDSLTAGYHSSGMGFEPYGAHLQAELGQASPAGCSPVDVCGMSGWTTAEMVAAVDERICTDVCGQTGSGLRWLLRDAMRSSEPYRVVLIMAGTNDLGSPSPAKEIASNLATLHACCHELGAATVAIGVPEGSFSVRGAPLSGKRQEVNRLLRDWVESTSSRGNADSSSSCSYINMSPEVPFANESPLWEPDGLHLSPAGSRHFGRVIAAKILQTGLLPVAATRGADHHHESSELPR